MEVIIILLIGLEMMLDIAHTTESTDTTGYLTMAKSCMGHPKQGNCMFNNINCVTNRTKIIMVNEIVYKQLTCDRPMKKDCSSSEECCSGPSHTVKPYMRNLLDFETYSECSGKPACFHNFWFKEVRTQAELQEPLSMDVGYQCIEEKKIQHLCKGGFHVGNQAHVVFNRHQSKVDTSSNCTCRVIPSTGQQFRLHQVDIRLQKNWKSSLNENDVKYQCSKSALYLSSNGELECNPSNFEFSTMMSTRNAEMSELDITLKNLVPDILENPMMVWLAIEGLNNSEVKVVCGAPNVFPEISWFQDQETLQLAMKKIYTTYVVVALVVGVCVCALIVGGCSYSRYMSRRRSNEGGEINFEPSVSTPMCATADTERTVLKEETEKSDVTPVNCSDKNETKVDMLIEYDSHLKWHEATPSAVRAEQHTSIRNGVVNKSDITLKTVETFSTKQSNIITSV